MPNIAKSDDTTALLANRELHQLQSGYVLSAWEYADDRRAQYQIHALLGNVPYIAEARKECAKEWETKQRLYGAITQARLDWIKEHSPKEYWKDHVYPTDAEMKEIERIATLKFHEAEHA